MGAHLLNVEAVAGVAHHGFGFVGAFELAFAVDGKTGGRLVLAQPVRHGGLGRSLGVEQRQGKTRPQFGEHGADLVGAALAAGINAQKAGIRVNPHPGGALLGEGHGQQVELGFFFEFAAFFLAGLAAAFLFDAGFFLVHFARQHAGGQHFRFGHEAGNPLPGHAFEQRAVRFAARRHKAAGVFLRSAASVEGSFLQRGFSSFPRHLPGGRDAVNDQVFEHANPCEWCGGAIVGQCFAALGTTLHSR